MSSPNDQTSVVTAVQQKLSGVTGDQTSPLDRSMNSVSQMGGVFSRWADNMSHATDPLHPGNKPFSSMTTGQQAAAVTRVASNIVGGVMGMLNLPLDALNVGFANLTAPLAAIYPSFPAATLTAPWLGSPHTHLHPPSLIPPAPPIPLPSIGVMLIGNCLRVLVGGLPAARCGDLGLAPTCGGLTPWFSMFLGSSNVFIGGKRAARMLDMGFVCSSAAPAASAVSSAFAVAGVVVSGLGIAADVTEMAVSDDAAMASAKAISAAMNSAQMAADAAAMAVANLMGKDPAAVPPKPPGALLAGVPTVLVGGFPMINIPNPAEALLNKLAALRAKAAGPEAAATQGSNCE